MSQLVPSMAAKIHILVRHQASSGQHHLPCRMQLKRLQKTSSVHHPITGEEADIFSRGDYLSIQGQVEKVSYFNVVNDLSGNTSALLCCLNEDENEESLLITHPHEVANPYD